VDPTAKVVIILENDLGFVFWLGQTLDRANYTVLPARTSAEGEELLTKLRLQPDLMIVNPSLSGVETFVELNRRSNPRLKVIVLDKRGSDTVKMADAVRFKPEAWEETSAFEWLSLVAKLLDNAVIH
jgi:DNA-binding response OmpR family regulator